MRLSKQVGKLDLEKFPVLQQYTWVLESATFTLGEGEDPASSSESDFPEC